MDKLKLLNLFILAFLLSFLVQTFFLPKPQSANTPTGAYLTIQSESISVPNIPQITLHNTSSGVLTVHPCQDVTLTLDSVPLSGFESSAPGFCAPLTVTTGSSALLPMRDLYRLFATSTGKYTLSVKTPFGDRLTAFTVGAPGMISRFFSATVYEPIYNLFVALITYLPAHSLGWAIIIVTIIVRLILLVPQHHMLEWQKKLQKIQPKLKALQKEYKDDQATLGMKMMELYKAEGVNPLGSIVPLLIQMPILIGLYWVISQINDPSNFYHLYSFFANFDPSTISTFFYGLHLDQVGGMIGLVFALVLGALQYIQAKLSFHYTSKKTDMKLSEESPEVAALDPAMMQKMMLYFFPVMIAVTSYFFPLGVGLYWFIGTLFVIAQQAYVNRGK